MGTRNAGPPLGPRAVGERLRNEPGTSIGGNYRGLGGGTVSAHSGFGVEVIRAKRGDPAPLAAVGFLPWDPVSAATAIGNVFKWWRLGATGEVFRRVEIHPAVGASTVFGPN